MEASSASLEPLLNMKVTVAVDDTPPFGADVRWAYGLNAELDSTAGLNQRVHNDDCIWRATAAAAALCSGFASADLKKVLPWLAL